MYKPRQFWCNRNVLSAPYIAIELDPSNGGDSPTSGINYNLDIVNIYNQNIEQGTFDILSLYGMSSGTVNTNLYYSKISEAITIDINDPDFGLSDSVGNKYFVFYKGDCFLQKYYFKQVSWEKSDFQADETYPVGTAITDTGSGDFVAPGPSPWIDKPDTGSSDDKNRYAHGIIMGIIVECTTNPAMRHQTSPRDFYPHTNIGEAWGAFPKYNAGDENFLYNYGYHRQLSLQKFIHYNPYITYQIINHKTRIRHTPLNIPYALTDAYRVLNAGDFKDYDLAFNQIVALINLHGMLVSVQEDAINEHFIEEQQLKAPQTSGDLVLGLGAILSQNVRRIANFGSQHQWSVHKLGYGVDWRRRILWGLGVGSSPDTGNTYGIIKNLSKECLIERWVYELFDSYDLRTDIINVLPDTPVNGIGIVTGYDPKYRDVIFTFLFKKIKSWTYNLKTASPYILNLIAINGIAWWNSLVPVLYVPGTIYTEGQLVYDQANNTTYYIILSNTTNIYCESASIESEIEFEEIKKSLVYNIDLGIFTGEVSFWPNIYMNINNEMFTNSGHNHYLHNINIPALFYGVQYKGILSYIVNGGDKFKNISKIFTNETLESNEQPFSRILFETQYQQGIHNGDTLTDFRTTEFWRNPEYNEHKWELPIFVQTSAKSNDFDTESEMRGYWLKVTVEYFKNIPQYLKKTITKFIISKTS
jgi:hypothetical protein